MNHYADIIIPLNINQFYTYSIPEANVELLQKGTRVLVNFGKRKFYTGIVVNIHTNKPDYETKEIDSVLDDSPIVSELQIKFWIWLSHYYMAPIGAIMTAALPTALKLESSTELIFNPEEYCDEVFNELSTKAQDIVLLIKQQQKVKLTNIPSVNSSNITNLLKPLIDKGLISIQEKVYKSFHAKKETYYEINKEVDINEFIDTNKRSKKQIEALQLFIEYTENAPISKKDFITKTNCTTTIIKALVDKGVVIKNEIEVSRFDRTVVKKKEFNVLNDAQTIALRDIKHSFESKIAVLLHGVTSSGKTEIFIHLIKEYLDKGKQILYLLPEIALTGQIVNRLKEVFGDLVCTYHSRLNANERAELWKDLNENKKYKIVLGVRSSIFLPIHKLGLIIVDEEHESSYKQYNAMPFYNARDSAVMLAHLHGAKVLLATATPSVESFYNAKNGKYGLVSLTTRYKNLQLPTIKIADRIHETKKKAMISIFTPLLYNSINEALDNKEQIILFQNRRGFSPYMICDDCGEVIKCKHCDVSLTYHRRINALVCHYCGYTISNRNICPSCNSKNVKTQGYGTERIESEVKLIFPNAKVGRLDLDTTQKKNSHEKIINKFEDGDLDILIGTQMVTKGLDFKNVTVVGVLNADNMLNFPDFRALERSFQLMVQVSGRAGRSNGKGNVIIQTSNPKHNILNLIKQNNYEGMFRAQLSERKDFQYPPFVNLIKITLKHKKEDICHDFSVKLSIELRKYFGARILGPEIPMVNRIQTYYIRNIFAKIEKSNKTPQSKAQIIRTCELLKHRFAKSIIIGFDVDPM